MSGPARPGWRRWSPWALVAALVVALGVASQGSGPGAPLDPNGTGRQGAKALVLLLRHYGATVDLTAGLPAPGTGGALVLADQLDDARRVALAAWVREGGRLVVADPSSPLETGVPTRLGNGFSTADLAPGGSCAVPGLETVTRLAAGTTLLLRPPPRRPGTACFGYELDDHTSASFLLAEPVGAGTVIGLGGAGLWTNARLDLADNAALAVDLLAPASGTRVAVLTASPAGSGTKSLVDLLSPRLRSALIELLVAFAALAWWRGRRLGRPVSESGVVQVAASEIVVAVGDLLNRTGNRQTAGRQLQDGCRRALAERLGLGPNATVDQVVDAAAARSAVPPADVRELLAGAPVTDDAGLVVLARSLAHLRQEVIGGPLPVSRDGA